MNIFDAAASNDAEIVEQLIRNCGNDPNETDEWGRSALHICASKGHMAAAEKLLKNGASVILKDRESGWTPLHRALYSEQIPMSMVLLKAGALMNDNHLTTETRYNTHSSINLSQNTKSLQSSASSVNTPSLSDVKDKDGLTPLDLLSQKLSSNLKQSRHHLKSSNILCFGKSDFMLGVPLPKSSSDVVRPRCINSLVDECITQICAGKYHSVALTREGSVYSWGHGRSGRLGHGNEVSQPDPKLIASPLLRHHRVCIICTGENHTLAVTASGHLFSWGSDRFGQLGFGGAASSTPQQASAGSSKNQSSSPGVGIAMPHAGSISTSSSNGGGGSGSGSVRLVLEPRRVESLRRHRVIGAACGDAHSICYTDEGELYAWGSNKHGQLGLRATEVSTNALAGGGPGTAVPRRVYIDVLSAHGIDDGRNLSRKHSSRFLQEYSKGKCNIIQVSASYSNTLLLCKGYVQQDWSQLSSGGYVGGIQGYAYCARPQYMNEVYQWGHGIFQPTKVHFWNRSRHNSFVGAAGPSTNPSRAPRNIGGASTLCDADEDLELLAGFEGGGSGLVQITQVAAGKHHYVGLSADKCVYTWGLGKEQLGHGHGHGHGDSSPKTSGATTSSVSKGGMSGAGGGGMTVKSTWDLGSGFALFSQPKQVVALLPEHGGGDVVQVSAAHNRTCAITEVGDVYTWGATDQKVRCISNS